MIFNINFDTKAKANVIECNPIKNPFYYAIYIDIKDCIKTMLIKIEKYDMKIFVNMILM